jgi:putative alpha-1,2-mannosidase
LSKATIDLHNGKKFRVLVKNASKENIYIQSMKMNGKAYTKTYITHQDILNGSSVEFTMGPEPNKNWGVHTPPPLESW